MPYTVRTIAKPREVKKVKDVLLKEKKYIKQKPLKFAVGAGGVPPQDDGNKYIKKPLTPEQIQKIMNCVGNNNKMLINNKKYIFNK